MDDEPRNQLTLLELHPELREAFEMIRPYCAEVEYVDSGAFQGGDEDCFMKGMKDSKKDYFVFSLAAVPFRASGS